jgi:hypothetical protein
VQDSSRQETASSGAPSGAGLVLAGRLRNLCGRCWARGSGSNQPRIWGLRHPPSSSHHASASIHRLIPVGRFARFLHEEFCEVSPDAGFLPLACPAACPGSWLRGMGSGRPLRPSGVVTGPGWSGRCGGLGGRVAVDRSWDLVRLAAKRAHWAAPSRAASCALSLWRSSQRAMAWPIASGWSSGAWCPAGPIPSTSSEAACSCAHVTIVGAAMPNPLLDGEQQLGHLGGVG